MVRNIKLLYASLGMSIFASNLGSFLISLLVYDMTGSKLATGGVWLIVSITQLIVQFILGPFLDSWPRKSVLLISESFRAIIFLGILLSIIVFQRPLVILYISVFLINLSLFEPVANAFIPSLVNKSELHTINGKFSSIQQLMRIFGMMSAGVVNLIGIEYGIMLVIILFVISTFLVFGIKDTKPITKAKTTWLFQFKKGLQIYRERPTLLYLTILLAISNFSVAAVSSMSIPYVYEILQGNSVSYGFYTSAWSIGYIVGGSLYTKSSGKKGIFSVRGMIMSLIIGSFSYLLLAVTNNIVLAIIIECIAGLSAPIWNIHSAYLYQINTPDDIRAQVFSMRTLIGRSISPLGILFGTVYSTFFGVQHMMIVVGILSLVCYIVINKRFNLQD